VQQAFQDERAHVTARAYGRLACAPSFKAVGFLGFAPLTAQRGVAAATRRSRRPPHLAPPLDKPTSRRLSRRVHHLIGFFPRRLLTLLACFLAVHFGVASDKPEKPAATTNSVAGKWAYTLDVSLDTSIDFTAELKQEGERVTGFITVQELKTAIEKGQFKDGQLTFEIPREYGGVKFTSRYTGKLTGDTLTGKIVSGAAPVERTYEWSAKREKASAKR
jgi:hypothetical protein